MKFQVSILLICVFVLINTLSVGGKCVVKPKDGELCTFPTFPIGGHAAYSNPCRNGSFCQNDKGVCLPPTTNAVLNQGDPCGSGEYYGRVCSTGLECQQVNWTDHCYPPGHLAVLIENEQCNAHYSTGGQTCKKGLICHVNHTNPMTPTATCLDPTQFAVLNVNASCMSHVPFGDKTCAEGLECLMNIHTDHQFKCVRPVATADIPINETCEIHPTTSSHISKTCVTGLECISVMGGFKCLPPNHHASLTNGSICTPGIVAGVYNSMKTCASGLECMFSTEHNYQCLNKDTYKTLENKAFCSEAEMFKKCKEGLTCQRNVLGYCVRNPDI